MSDIPGMCEYCGSIGFEHHIQCPNYYPAYVEYLSNELAAAKAREEEANYNVQKVIRQRDLWDRTCQELRAEVERAKSDGEEVRKQLTARLAELCVDVAELKHDMAKGLERETNLLAEVERLRKVLKELLSYTEACEGMLNASPAGQVKNAHTAIGKEG